MSSCHAGLTVTLGSAFAACVWTAPAHASVCDVAEVAKLLAPNAAPSDLLGAANAVAISGDTVVVGARRDDCASDAGAAYVFRYIGAVWVLEATLQASDCAEGGFFGSSTAIDGNIAVIGSQGDLNYTGSAYVFRRDDNGTPGDPIDDFWIEGAKLLASDGVSGDYFGTLAAVFGDTIAMGVNVDDSYTDAAYVFDKPAGGWSSPSPIYETAKLTACDAKTDAFFGGSVTIFDDTVVIGAYVDDNENGHNAGSAYVFQRAAGWSDGCTNQVAKLLAADGGPSDQFGYPVSIFDATVVIGAYVDDGAAGSAYVFNKGAGWNDGNANQVAKLTASDRQPGDWFGFGAGISGDIVIVGALARSSRTGAAYVFQKPLGGWGDMTETLKLTRSDAGANHEFGVAAISGDTAVVGAGAYDNQSGAEVGTAYVFSMSAADCPSDCP